MNLLQIMTSMSVLLGAMTIAAALYDMGMQRLEATHGRNNVIYAPRACFLP